MLNGFIQASTNSDVIFNLGVVLTGPETHEDRETRLNVTTAKVLVQKSKYANP